MQSISPETIFRGNNAWQKSLPQIIKLTKNPLILGRGIHTNNLRNKIFHDLKNQSINVNSANLQFDCCYEDISRVKNIILKNNHDSVIAAGGGKVLDSGKYIADCLNIPCITVPLSASTCAGWTALSNIYTKDGQFIKDVALRSCPKILVFDHKFIQTAPSRTLASGIADALAKWYESSLTSSTIDDGLVQQAIQISRVLRDQLLIDGEKKLSCNLLAKDYQNCEITTIEGLENNDGLNNVQKAFKEFNAAQCGYCTSGIIISITALFDKNKKPSSQEIQNALDGHLCRCGSHSVVLNAIESLKEN